MEDALYSEQFDLTNILIHEVFLKNVLSQPNAVALMWDSNSLSYNELNNASNYGAEILSKLGVKPGIYVPILLNRSPELIVSLLSVLKAGAAYTILDPNWPSERIEEILKSLNSDIIISDKTFPSQEKYRIWTPMIYRSMYHSPSKIQQISNDSPCCVFFTSGTTGIPKGVITPHKAITRFFRSISFTSFSEDTIIPLAASFAWDAFALELWSALLNGGTAWIIDEPYLSPHSIRIGKDNFGVNTVWLTSSLLNMIIDEDPYVFDGLRTVMTGGERLSVRHISKFITLHPSIELINGYGPVENTIFTTTHRVNVNSCMELSGIPIGSLVPETQVYILDQNKLCKEGNIGEICIAGNGLALGYLNDHNLTKQKFVSIDINDVPTKMYRSGDLGFFKNGVLHYKGRIDRQVKIRGHRVELSDIECKIEKTLKNVHSCRIIAKRDDNSNVTDLIAFCIPVSGNDPLDNALSVLHQFLPQYQCPSKIISVPHFPLTSRGKLDESALLSVFDNYSKKEISTQFSSQFDDATLEQVANIFGAVLNCTPVPINISLFNLGGTSIDIGRICTRLSSQFDCIIPLSTLYQYTTVESLSNWIKSNIFASCGKKNNACANQFPLRPMQLIYLMRFLRNPKDFTSHCLITWRLDRNLELSALQAAVNYTHQQHHALRARYQIDPKPLIILSDIPPPPLEILSPQDSIEKALEEIRNEFSDILDPTKADIWRAVLVPLNNKDSYIFSCVIHHIAFDGWSESILAKYLSAGYNASEKYFITQDCDTLPMRGIIDMQKKSEISTNLDQITSFSSELSGTPQIQWPIYNVDNNLNGIHSCNINEISYVLPRDLVNAIDKFAIQTKSTRFEIFFIVWASVLAQVTGQSDFCIGVPVRQRNTPSLENTIGCYINMLCIRVRKIPIPANLTIKSIHNMRCNIRQSLARQDIPLYKILELVKIERNERPPLFQTLFALQDNPHPYLELKDVGSTFIRQPYLELPLELHAEIWPSPNGSLELSLSYQTKYISTQLAEQFGTLFVNAYKDQTSLVSA
ncbi:MAG: AMP-binding protein [Pseudomonadota bacterium]